MNKETLLESAEKFRTDLYKFIYEFNLKEIKDGGKGGSCRSISSDSDKNDELNRVFEDITNCMTKVEMLLFKRQVKELKATRQTESGYSTSSCASTFSEVFPDFMKRESKDTGDSRISTQETEIMPSKLDQLDQGTGNQTMSLQSTTERAQQHDEACRREKVKMDTVVAHPTDESSEEEEISEAHKRQKNEQHNDNNENRKAMVIPEEHFETTAEISNKEEYDDDDISPSDNPAGQH